MKVAHTPGPWSNDFNVEISVGHKSICGMRFPFDEEEHQANAWLIAAAPDLLAALNALQANPNDPRAHRQALDAIAKAVQS